MRLGDLLNLPLSSQLGSRLSSFVSTPWLWHMALTLGSHPGPICYAAMEMLAKEMGRWVQEEMLPCILRTRVYTYLNL